MNSSVLADGLDLNDNAKVEEAQKIRQAVYIVDKLLIIRMCPGRDLNPHVLADNGF